MADYIERQKVLALGYCHCDHLDFDNPFPDWVNAVDTSDIEAMPAADVVEVVHGRWENGNAICPVCGKDKFKDLDADIWCDWKPAYYPNCGAKMDGGSDNAAD